MGTALACLLANNGHAVTLYTPFSDEAEKLKKDRTHKILPGLIIPEEIKVTTDLVAACESEFLLFASPSIFIRDMVSKAKPYTTPKQIIINVANGIEEETLYTMSQVIHEVLPHNPVVVLSGPTHAEEVAQNLLTTIVAASENLENAIEVAGLFKGSTLKVYTNSDVEGISDLGYQ